MKLKTKLIVGLAVLVGIFTTSSVSNLYLDEQLEDVANYHNFMSIPAITTLDRIAFNYARMNGEFHEFMAEPNERDKEESSESYTELIHLIDAYNSLAFEKNEKGEYFASEMMRQDMETYVEQMKTSSQSFQEIITKFEPNSLANQEMLEELEINEDEFLGIVDEARQMEVQGQINEQTKIDTIASTMESINHFSLIATFSVSLVVAFVIIRAINNPIKQIKDATDKIAQGNFTTKIQHNNKNELDELAENINKMAYELNSKTDQIKKQERLTAIGELAARIAHDLRNPLSALKLSIDLIRREMPPEELEASQGRFRVIDRSIDRMSHQVENVLDYLKERSLNLNSCNISDIIKQTFADITVPKNVKIKFELSNVNVVCDSEKIETTIANLLTNAIQAISEGGQINVKTSGDDKSAIIEIQDSGKGIDESIQDKIFEPLFTTKQTGTGLGLASCKKIVEAHHGTISYKNHPSTFVVKLPRLVNQHIKQG